VNYQLDGLALVNRTTKSGAILERITPLYASFVTTLLGLLDRCERESGVGDTRLHVGVLGTSLLSDLFHVAVNDQFGCAVALLFVIHVSPPLIAC